MLWCYADDPICGHGMHTSNSVHRGFGSKCCPCTPYCVLPASVLCTCCKNPQRGRGIVSNTHDLKIGMCLGLQSWRLRLQCCPLHDQLLACHLWERVCKLQLLSDSWACLQARGQATQASQHTVCLSGHEQDCCLHLFGCQPRLQLHLCCSNICQSQQTWAHTTGR